MPPFPWREARRAWTASAIVVGTILCWVATPTSGSAASPVYPDHLRQRLDFSPRFELAGGTITAIAVAPDGRIHATGLFSSAGSEVRVGVLRYLPDGTVDPNYRVAPLLGGTGSALLLLPDGKLLVAGTFTHVGIHARAGLVRLLADGAVDPAFDPGAGFGLEPTALAIAPQGSVYLAGHPAQSGAAPPGRLLRILPDGTRDVAFDAGTAFTASITALVSRPDGSLYANGNCFNPGATDFPYTFTLVRLHPDGTRDTMFAPPLTGRADVIIRQPDGHLLVGGTLDSAEPAPRKGMVRLREDGTIDQTFRADGFTPPIAPYYQLAQVGPVDLRPDGTIVIESTWIWTQMLGSQITRTFFRLLEDGALDASFAPAGEFPTVLANGADDKLLAVFPAGHIARLENDGSVDQAYTSIALRRPGAVNVITPTGTDRWLVGGDFHSIDGVERRHLARLESNGSVDTTFDPGASLSSAVRLVVPLPDGRILTHEDDWISVHVLKGSFVTYPRGRLVRLAADGARDTAFGGNWFTARITVLSATENEILFGYGRPVSYNYLSDHLIRMPDNGHLPDPFTPPDPRGTAAAVAPLPGGGFIGAVSRVDPWAPASFGLSRFDASGAIDPTFVSTTVIDGRIDLLKRQADGRVLAGWNGGSNAPADALSPRRLARFEANGSLDATFDTGTGFRTTGGAFGELKALLLQEDGRMVVAGTFTTCDDVGVPGLVRLRSDGSVDPDFHVDGLLPALTRPRTIAYTTDQQLLVGGEWTWFTDTGTLGMGLVALQPAAHPRISAVSPPQSATAGTALTLHVDADSTASLFYHWQHLMPGAAALGANPAADTWVDIAGATGASYTIPSAQSFHSGSYRVVVSAGGTNVASDPVIVTVNAAPPSNARLVNLSTRAQALTGDNVLIPGFVVAGTGTKKLLIRAVGPTLGTPPFNLGGTLPDPSLRLLKRNPATTLFEEIAANDNWGTNSNSTAIMQTAADLFAFAFNDDREAALLLELAPGEYTATAGPATSSGSAGATGLAIIELYDADAASTGSRLINISNRGFAGVGDQVMIPGFVVSPEGPKTLLVRVVGPTLGNLGVPGTMADPKLTVFSGQTAILTNDNWSDSPDAAHTTQIASAVQAFPLPSGSADAAFVVTLQPGSYTVVGSSAVAGGTGVVLVEVYVVP